MKKYLVAGFRKGTKDNSIYNFNARVYDEKSFRESFAWIDGEDGNNFREGNTPLTLNDVIAELNDVGALWCENDDFFFMFKFGAI